ncbi:hypothetical protein Syun_016563 [Stephania yunnanensis]|uniref:Tyrosine specific protein phosphatases domain-containing protein n=1 Tax=Stephania yunnanensis TaxID=152371 RepID=A0AAP0P514_9MAGN
MGISRLIGLKASVMLLLFIYLRRFGLPLISFPFLHAFLVSILVSISSHPIINLPLLLGKTSDGYLPIWSQFLFGPYLWFVRLFVPLRRFVSGEPPYSEVCDGVYVGGWPFSLDRLPPGDPAVIDCTCELPRSVAVSSSCAYLCVPTWDTRAPLPADIESAVNWACRKRAQKQPVFIHCAFGHGRSVTVTCALLVALGVAEDWKSAERIIRERRPCIRLNSLHRKALEEWSKSRVPSQRSDGLSVSSIILPNSPTNLRSNH